MICQVPRPKAHPPWALGLKITQSPCKRFPPTPCRIPLPTSPHNPSFPQGGVSLFAANNERDSTLRQSPLSGDAGIGAVLAEIAPDLREVLDAWPGLDANIRAAIIAIVKTNAVFAP